MHWLHHGVRTGCKSPQTRPVAADAAMATDFRCHKLFRLFEPFNGTKPMSKWTGAARSEHPPWDGPNRTPLTAVPNEMLLR